MTGPTPTGAAERTDEELPADVAALIGEVRYEEAGEFPVERGYIWTSASSVENANPLFWDDEVAEAVTGGPIAMPTMLSVWFRPHHWAPGRTTEVLPLQVHFDLKERFGLPEAVMSDNTIIFGVPVRPGDRLRTHQILRSVSAPKTTRLGTGRFWVIDVEYHNQHDELVGIESYTGFGYRRAEGAGTGGPAVAGEPPRDRATGGDEVTGPTADRPAAATTPRLVLDDITEGQVLRPLRHDVSATTVVLGALAARDWRPMHHDHDFAVNRNGTRDIFLNTPNLAAWFERYLTDWTGPHGRLGRMTFRMVGSIFPGDTMVFGGTVTAVRTDGAGCGWADVAVDVSVDGHTKTSCAASIAVPTSAGDNPWDRAPDRWTP
jgi:uncharacterized protein